MSAVAGPATLVVTGGQIVPQRCGLYAHSCAILDQHHVVPESWWRAAGLPVSSPLVKICPSCHMGVHSAIDGLVRGLDISLLPKRHQALARQAMTLGVEAGLTPAVTLLWGS